MLHVHLEGYFSQPVLYKLMALMSAKFPILCLPHLDKLTIIDLCIIISPKLHVSATLCILCVVFELSSLLFIAV